MLARNGTRSDLTRRFLRRHRWGVAASAMPIAALSAGLAGTLWQARRAEAQAARSEAVKNFLAKPAPPIWRATVPTTSA